MAHPVDQAPARTTRASRWERARQWARRRGGFTLLEILVVIGIIILLVAMGVIGFQALDQSGKVTKAALSNLQSMLAEYQAMNGLRDQPEQIWRNTATVSTKVPANNASLWAEQVDVRNGANVAGGGPQRYEWGPVGNTQLVYQFLNRLPSNKQLITKLPSKQIHGMADGGDRGKVLLGPSDKKVIDPPLILDAWNNPVIFVGSDGMIGVALSGKSDKPFWRITSGGIVDASVPLTSLPRSARPFFASAGPDGDFRTGDDNVYSFEQ
jgi:type II secretory pathway pseudopilin PulG